jgi:hypothetical protein
MMLEPTPGDQKRKILAALDKLQAGGSTAGGAGLRPVFRKVCLIMEWKNEGCTPFFPPFSLNRSFRLLSTDIAGAKGKKFLAPGY